MTTLNKIDKLIINYNNLVAAPQRLSYTLKSAPHVYYTLQIYRTIEYNTPRLTYRDRDRDFIVDMSDGNKNNLFNAAYKILKYLYSQLNQKERK